MLKSRFSETQIVEILKEGEAGLPYPSPGLPIVSQLCCVSGKWAAAGLGHFWGV